MAETSNTNWADLLNAVIALWGMKKGEQTPNFYPAPLTPTEQWKSDASKGTFDFQSQYVKQLLGGMSDLNPKGFQQNPLVAGGSEFMGGVKAPTFDMSKFGMPSSGASTPGTAPPGGGGGGGGGAGDPFGSIMAPGGSEKDPFGNWPDPSSTAHNVTMEDVKKYGPEAIKYVNALVGGGLPLAAAIQWALQKFGGASSTLPSGKDFSGIDTTPANTTLPKGRDFSGIDTTPKGYKPPRDVTVGGNLGKPGEAPPGWDYNKWYENYYGQGGVGPGSPRGRKGGFLP